MTFNGHLLKSGLVTEGTDSVDLQLKGELFFADEAPIFMTHFKLLLRMIINYSGSRKRDQLKGDSITKYLSLP